MSELRACRVELELTTRQRRWCERACAASRITYNWGLAEWRRWHRWNTHRERAARLLKRWGSLADADSFFPGKPNRNGIDKRFRAGPKAPGGHLAWMRELGNSYLDREAIAALGVAYSAFFRRLKKHRSGDHSECGKGRRGRCSLGAPRFHKRRHDEGFSVDQASALKTRVEHTSTHRARYSIYIPGLGWFRIKSGQRIPVAAFDPKAPGRPCTCGREIGKRGMHRQPRKLPDGTVVPGCEGRSGGWVGDPDTELCGVSIRRWGGRWYASLRVRAPAKTRARDPKRRIAVEVGVRYRAVTYTESDSGVPRVGTFSDTRTDPLIIKLERRRKLWERRMARRFKSGKRIRDQSRGWFEARNEVARLHRRIAQVRADRIHWATRQIVNSAASEIVVRDMAVKDLLQRGVMGTDQDRRRRNALAPSVHQSGMAEFRRQLEYKQAWAHGTVVVHQRSVPETRQCGECGEISERAPGYPWFVCHACGHADDRDTNAARVRYDYRTPSGDPVACPGTPGANSGRNSTNGRENRNTGSRRISGGSRPDGDETITHGSGKGATRKRRESNKTTPSPRDASGTIHFPEHERTGGTSDAAQ